MTMPKSKIGGRLSGLYLLVAGAAIAIGVMGRSDGMVWVIPSFCTLPWSLLVMFPLMKSVEHNISLPILNSIDLPVLLSALLGGCAMLNSMILYFVGVGIDVIRRRRASSMRGGAAT